MSFAFRPQRPRSAERTHAPSAATHAAVFTARAGAWLPKSPPSRMTMTARTDARVRPTRRAPRWVQMALPWGR